MSDSLQSWFGVVAEKVTSRGWRAVVATAAPEAAAIGRDALRAGGNAFDAALAAALAETVLLPPKCGLAGDLVALCLRPDQPPTALVAIGPAPVGLGDVVREQGALPLTGGLAVGIPAAPAGYAALARLGRRGLQPAVSPSIELAEHGFAWSTLNEHYARRAQTLLEKQIPAGNSYLPGGGLITAGSRVTLPGLAKTLNEFAHRGAELFSGPVGDALVAAVRSRGGVMTHQDLARAEARWQTPVSATVAGQRVWSTPSPTHGPSLLTALDSAMTEPDCAATLRNGVEAAICARGRWAEDAVGDGGTSVVSATDAEGNAIVLVHSNSHPTFGSGIVMDGYDLILSNRAGRGFTPVLGHPNFPAPHRRPVTTLHAWALGPVDGPPNTVGATSGGENQMPWNAQVLARLLQNTEPADAILAPRWARRGDGALTVEEGFSTRERAALTGSTIDVPRWSLPSGMQATQSGSTTQPLTATADIRSIGGTASL